MGPGLGRRDQGRAKNRPVYPRDHQARGLRPSPTTPQRGDTPQNQGEGPDPDRPRDENTPHRTGEGDRDDSRPGQEAPEPQTRSDQDGEGVQGAGRWGRARCSRTTTGRPDPRRAKKASTAARRLLMVAAPRSVAEANRSVKTASSAARSSGRSGCGGAARSVCFQKSFGGLLTARGRVSRSHPGSPLPDMPVSRSTTSVRRGAVS